MYDFSIAISFSQAGLRSYFEPGGLTRVAHIVICTVQVDLQKRDPFFLYYFNALATLVTICVSSTTSIYIHPTDGLFSKIAFLLPIQYPRSTVADMPFVTEELSLETMDACSPLVSGLIASRQIFTARNPKSSEIYSSSPQYFPGNNTRTLLHSLPFPIVRESGASCYRKSVDGDFYLDFCGEYTSGIYGHNHPSITASIIDTCRNGLNFGGIDTQEKNLAQIVCERFMLDSVRFANTGTEANMMALALATNYTGRKTIHPIYESYAL